MMQRWWCGLGAVLMLTLGSGCFLREQIQGTFSNKAVEMPDMPQASVEAAMRVDRIGRKLATATPQLNVMPSFQTVGVKDPEIFHANHDSIFITEGLINLCKNDDELAAVIAHELGEMAAEVQRQKLMNLQRPMPSMVVPNKPDGSTDYDLARLTELAQYEKKRQENGSSKPVPQRDTQTWAEQILKSAGYDVGLYRQVEPILRTTERHSQLATQMSGQRGLLRW